MSRRLLIILMALLSLPVLAQEEASVPSQVRFGYLSYDSVLHAMPDYALVRQQLAGLQAKYQAELQRVESEFNQKYEAFLEGQKEFPPTILKKRQTELQQLLQRNIAFKQQSRQELQQAEADALAPLKARLAEVLAAVAAERRLALIVNTDANACPFISPDWAEFVGDIVKERLQP